MQKKETILHVLMVVWLGNPNFSDLLAYNDLWANWHVVLVMTGVCSSWIDFWMKTILIRAIMGPKEKPETGILV